MQDHAGRRFETLCGVIVFGTNCPRKSRVGRKSLAPAEGAFFPLIDFDETAVGSLRNLAHAG
jgi:hypothetical protein